MTTALRARMASGFFLEKLGGLAAWYAADRITGLSDGAAVATWADLSGNARHASQGTGANQPLYKTAILNGQPVVRFDGTNDYLRCTAATWGTAEAQPNTILIVATMGGGLVGTDILIDGPGGAGRHLIYNGSNATLSFFAGAQVDHAETHPIAASLFCWEVNGASSVIRKNGSAYATGDVGSQAMGGVTIGADQGAGSPLSGDIAELVVFGRLLSSDERSLVERYLGAKYGITVP